MILPNPKRTKYILDLLVNENYDYVWVASLSTFTYELHTNESVTPLAMPETGNALDLLDLIKDNFVDDEYKRDFSKAFRVRKLLHILKTKKGFELDFPFNVGLTYIKCFYYDEKNSEVILCAKQYDEDQSDAEEASSEALLVMELDPRKHFSIKSVNENVSKVFGASLLKLSDGFKHDAFTGYHPEDRIIAEQLFLQNARDGKEFSGEFRVCVRQNVYQLLHLDVTVKKFKRSYFYYVTITKALTDSGIEKTQVVDIDDNPRRKVHSFDIDVPTQTAHLGREMCRYYNTEAVVVKFPESFLKDGLIHPDDGEKIENVIRAIRGGSPFEEIDIRVKNLSDDNYVWRSISLNTIFDEDGNPARALGYSEDISFYKDQEERFHEVLEICGFTTWDLNLETRKIENSTRLKKLFGLMDENLINAPESVIASGAIHRDDIDEIRNIHRKLREGSLSAECEFRGRNLNGGNFNWYKLRYTVVNDKYGNPQYAVGSATDINEQKVAELSYEYEAKTLYEMQGDTLVEKCCINATRNEIKSFYTKETGAISIARQSYTDVLKIMMTYAVNEDTSRLLWNRLNPDNLLKSFSQGNKTFSFVHRRQEKSSNLQWVSSKVNMYQDPKTGDIICFIYTYDINRKKLSQEALELIGTSDFDFVGIIDVIAGSAIILHDNDIMSRVPNWDCGDYDAYFEQYADRMHPFLDSEDDYVALHDKIKISSLVKELTVAPSYEILVKHHKSPNGETVVFRTTFRYLDTEQSSIILCMSDITSALAEEREREKVLKNALEQANIASKAKTDFLARMSHDIRTPLNGIMGMTQLAMEETDVDLIHEYLEKIDTSSHFLLGLLNDILDMSRIEKGVINLEDDIYSLSEFRASLESIIVPLCKNKDITLNVQIEGDYSFITDKQKFNQIFFNLLSNSVKFTEIGGTIDVIAENIQVNDGRFNADFIVRDYGCGMSEEFQTRMFEAFSQERNSMVSMSAGTGLGLAIVKSLVEKMGGTIDVWSSTKAEDHGTKMTVHFSLPVGE
ncbi:MAG: ATP-binding protein [Treponema sp.]|nr:ATP-binding protein [Treponema sp.]